VAAEAAAAAAPGAPQAAVTEIHRKAEAAYGRIMDQATKAADMRVVSGNLRGRKSGPLITFGPPGTYYVLAFFLTIYAGLIGLLLYQQWVERLQREQQEMQAKLSPPQDLEMGSGSESDDASPNKAFGISGASTRILFPLRETPRVYYEYTGGETPEEP